jgi:hypothetical protein
MYQLKNFIVFCLFLCIGLIVARHLLGLEKKGCDHIRNAILQYVYFLNALLYVAVIELALTVVRVCWANAARVLILLLAATITPRMYYQHLDLDHARTRILSADIDQHILTYIATLLMLRLVVCILAKLHKLTLN